MKLSKLRMTLHGIAGVIAVAGLLSGCSGSSDTAASSSSSGGGSTAPPITGVATPSSVSVVTAN